MSNEDSAAHYLGRYGPAASAALPDLRSTLDSDNPEKRQAAALAVALIDPKQVDAMLPHLLADMSEKTGYSRHRLKVIQGLGRIGPAAKAAAPGLRELLNREREPLTVSIAVALLKIAPDDTDAAYTSLRRYFAGEVTSYVPAKEFAGFGEQGLPLLDDLIRVIETPESRHSYQAVNLLAAIGPGASRAAPALEARLQQEKYDSQKEAIQAALRAILAEKSEGN
jgi:HEAT repeat protein